MEELTRAIRRLTGFAQTGPVTHAVWQEGIELYERVRTADISSEAKRSALDRLQVYPEAGLFYIAAKQIWLENPRATSWLEGDMRIYARHGVDGLMEANMEALKEGFRTTAPQHLRESPGVRRWLDEQIFRIFCAAQVNHEHPVDLSEDETGMIVSRLGREAVGRVLQETLEM